MGDSSDDADAKDPTRRTLIPAEIPLNNRTEDTSPPITNVLCCHLFLCRSAPTVNY
jgi:hypothetical protein